MQCRNCGTEIADKALICYRCGTATTEAKFKPAAIRGRRSSSRSVLSILVLALLVVAGLYTGSAVETETTRAAAWVATGVTAIVLVALLLRRR